MRVAADLSVLYFKVGRGAARIAFGDSERRCRSRRILFGGAAPPSAVSGINSMNIPCNYLITVI